MQVPVVPHQSQRRPLGGLEARPSNRRAIFLFRLRVRQGLVKSKNLVSIRLLQQIGLGPVRDWVARFGFEGDRQPDNLTLALGAGSTTPLQMAQAYAVLANGGQRVTPVVIERITDAKGQVLFEVPAASATVAEPVIPARNLFITNSMLGDVTRIGTAAKAQAQLNRADLYGKTGTTNDAVDAWFAGFQPSLVAVVWMGHDEPRSLGERESGGGLALPIWINFMRQALAGVPLAPAAEPPDGVQRLGDDWVYSEWADGSFVQGIGLAEMATEATGAASSPALAPRALPSTSPEPVRQ